MLSFFVVVVVVFFTYLNLCVSHSFEVCMNFIHPHFVIYLSLLVVDERIDHLLRILGGRGEDLERRRGGGGRRTSEAYRDFLECLNKIFVARMVRPCML